MLIVAGMEIVFVAFGGAVFGAIGMLMVMTYAWGARSTAREIHMTRFRQRIRERFRRSQKSIAVTVAATSD